MRNRLAARHSAGVAFFGLCLPAAMAMPAVADDVSPGPDLKPGTSLEIDVIAKALDEARGQIQPSLGATVYQLKRETIESQTQGDDAPFNQVLLQAPGVAQDSFGQVHVRGDHANLQFRIDGVQLPEGINVFGQALETRLADSVSLITGALPAQYGFRTAGIVDIQTKTGLLDPGGSISMYGGQQGWLQPSIEYVGQVNYFISGDFLHNSIGIENPTGSFNAVHDETDQKRAFAFLSGIVDQTTRVSAILGTSRGQYQIPNNPGQMPGLGLTVNGVTTFDSTDLDENQREITHYGILALQKKLDDVDFQVSAFSRYSSVYFSPDPLGDILFNGIAQTAYRRSVATGTQGDGSYRINDEHTLRAGYFIQGERSTSATASLAIALNPDGSQVSDSAVSILDSSGKTGWLYGVYLQDEWKMTPKVTLNFGARFDLVDEYTHENQISPRLNIVWEPTDTMTIIAGYARYFVPPPFELIGPTDIAPFANTSAAPAVTRDSVAKAERDHYFDIGATQIVLPGLRVVVDGYYKIARNLLDEGQFGAPILLTPFNYAKGRVRGAELSVTYDRDNLLLYGNFAASKAQGEDIDSAQFNFSPADLAYIADNYIHLDHDQTYTASAGIAYTFPTTKTRVSTELIYGSGLRAEGSAPNGNSLPDYHQVNLSIVQKIDTGWLKGAEARLDVINLFDEVYEIRNGTGVGVGAPQFGPRRTILAGLTQHF
ncbi:MAG TPA: TonB-dependent receptor [Stellaceae bacterium]|nr:TonB-dependent receptor [Stellaceae bacterium]